MELIVVSALAVLVCGVLGAVAVFLALALRTALRQWQDITERFAHLTMTTSEHYRDVKCREIDALVADAESRKMAAKLADAAAARPDLTNQHTITGDGLQPIGWNG